MEAAVINQKELIKCFEQANDSFSTSLNIIWPTVDSRGFTEANLVHTFLSVLNKELNATTYLEVPFKGQLRLDGLAFVRKGKFAHLVLIEAKRIKENQYDTAYRQIKSDKERMFDVEGIQSILSRISDEIISVGVQQIYIADVWIGNKKRSKEVKAIWESKDEQSLFKDWTKSFSDNLWKPGNGKVTYHRMLAVYKPSNFNKTTGKSSSNWLQE